ncbi:MAG: DNA translocase FtsK 4TM domain-containing protein [Anaerovoracaceae bacterium]
MANTKENTKKTTAAGAPADKKAKSSSAAGSKKAAGSGKKSGKSSSGKKPKKNPAGSRIRDEITAIFMVALGIFLILSVMTTATGDFGEILSMVLKGLFGLGAYILPFFLIIYALLILMNRMAHVNSRSVFFSVLLFLDLTMLNSVRFSQISSQQPWAAYVKDMFYTGAELKSAGVSGMLLGRLLGGVMGSAGLVITGVAVMIICVILIADTPVSVFFDRLRDKRNQKLMERQEAQEAYEREMEERAAQKEQTRQLRQAAEESRKKKQEAEPARIPPPEPAALPQYSEVPPAAASEPVHRASGGSSESSPFAGLKIKGAGFFRSSLEKKAAEEDFSQLPSNQRHILNLMKGEGSLGNQEQSHAEEEGADDLDAYQAADFFYDIRSISQRMEDTASAGMHHASAAGTDSLNEGMEAQHLQEDSSPNSWMKTEPAESEGPASGERASEAPADASASAQKPPEAPAPKEMTRAEMKAAAAQGAAELGAAISQAQSKPVKKEYKLPPLTLLNEPQRTVNRNEQRELKAKAARLEQVLMDFGVNAHVIDVKKGPAVTRYEIQPATGVKVSSITKLADDIALNLEAKSLRIEAPIPGKAAVGIEVENENSSMVTIREMIESKEFSEAKSKISFVVGEDIAGNHVTADLKSMPHLLIAGSTGSGKSVCINSLLISMLFKSTPDEVKFILIDPKVVELGNYNGIPHMLIPVVTDPTKAAAALAWSVQEMNDRYRKFAETAVRDLKAYNEKMKKEGHEENVMPQIVIIIDELADLMMAAGKQVEESICRLAQLARAAGMHLVVATQRPSVDVVTGLIKANIPSRIAFAVSSQVDSRTILDRAGAEKLVGKGDMMFYPLGKAQPERLQGPFVTDDEVSAVISFWKEQSDGDDEAKKILEAINTSIPEVVEEDEDDDELLPEAIELVVTSGQASASMLQRRYRIGYNRAGRLIDIMEMRGIIGPNEGSKPRKVLLTKEELDQRNASAAAETEAAVLVQPEDSADLYMSGSDPEGTYGAPVGEPGADSLDLTAEPSGYEDLNY